MQEFEFIRDLLRPLAKSEGADGLRDDVAVLPAIARPMIVTTDTIIEGRHFRIGDPWDTIGQKLIRVNVSDCLAKAAHPLACTLNMTWSTAHNEAGLSALIEGLAGDLAHCGIDLIGGDTTSHNGPVVLSLTLYGECQKEAGPIRRSGACIGEDVWVTGTIGDAGLGLNFPEPQQEAEAQLNARYLVPELPQLSLVSPLADHATASMDISDGLIADAGHLSRASSVSIMLNLAELPISMAARSVLPEALSDHDLLKLATAGDDYQTLFTAKKSARSALEDYTQKSGQRLTRIGETGRGSALRCLGVSGDEVSLPEKAGWVHSI